MSNVTQGYLKKEEPTSEDQWIVFARGLLEGVASPGPEPARLIDLGRIFGLSVLDRHILALCLAPNLNTATARLFSERNGNQRSRHATYDLLVGALAREKATAVRTSLAASGLLCRHKLLVFPGDASGVLYAADSPLHVSERVAEFLLCIEGIDPELNSVLTAYDDLHEAAPSPEPNPRLDRLRDHLVRGNAIGAGIACLFGASPEERLLAARKIARGLGRRLVALRSGVLPSMDRSTAFRLLERAGNEARLLEGLLYSPEVDANLARWLAAGSLPGLVILGDENPIDPTTLADLPPCFVLELLTPKAARREELWRAALGEIPTDADPGLLARRYRLPPDRIREAVRFALCRAIIEGRPPGMDEFVAGCRSVSNRALARLARRPDTLYDWEDLVVEPFVEHSLRGIVTVCEQREKFYGELGYHRRFRQGQGVAALFDGSSGTGKTMAASVIARALGRDLYVIDLSQVISKYIGETEKQLESIFREAETANAVLFFDEADAMFGKRSEVKDAHDRYANVEVAYLLQRIELYTGLVILATNFPQNIDEAFRRRIQFITHFTLPQAPERLRLWQRMFTPETPLAPDIDYEFLADRVELTGGELANVVKLSVMTAMSEGQPVSMKHILRAVKAEYHKENMDFIPSRFAPYSGN